MTVLFRSFCFCNDTATTKIYTLSYTTLFRSGDRLDPGGARVRVCAPHALPLVRLDYAMVEQIVSNLVDNALRYSPEDRKSTRLNSSHVEISYAVFCLKKKRNRHKTHILMTYR